MTAIKTLEEANAMIESRGFTPSRAGWDDGEVIFAFSVESHGRGTFGHPRSEIRIDRRTGSIIVR